MDHIKHDIIGRSIACTHCGAYVYKKFQKFKELHRDCESESESSDAEESNNDSDFKLDEDERKNTQRRRSTRPSTRSSTGMSEQLVQQKVMATDLQAARQLFKKAERARKILELELHKKRMLGAFFLLFSVFFCLVRGYPFAHLFFYIPYFRICSFSAFSFRARWYKSKSVSFLWRPRLSRDSRTAYVRRFILRWWQQMS